MVDLLLEADENVSFVDAPLTIRTQEALAVWAHVYADREDFVSKFGDDIHPLYLSGLSALNFSKDRFPGKLELDLALRSAGWRIGWVSGYIPSRVFAGLIADRCFPVASDVRALADVDHAPSPDAIHDIWGHLPFLFDATYSDYLVSIADAMLRAPVGAREVAMYDAQNKLISLIAERAPPSDVQRAKSELSDLEAEERHAPSRTTMLSRLFLWSIEFGLIGNTENFQVLGAGILSSRDEFMGVKRRVPSFQDYSKLCVTQEITFVGAQSKLFVSPSMDAYRDTLNDLLRERGSD